MTNANRFFEKEGSRSNLWLFVILITTVLALLITTLSLWYGHTDAAPVLFFIPVVIAAYRYPHRGPLFALIISFFYLGMVWYWTGGIISILFASSVTCYVLLAVSVLVSSLATHLRRNEVRYRSLFNHSPVGVGLIDLDTLSIREANPRFATLLGYSEEESILTPFGDIFLDAEPRDLFFRTLKTSGRAENHEVRLQSETEGTRWILISAGMLPENQAVISIIDITDRKNVELALLIKDYAIRSSITAIAILDPGFRIMYTNPSMISLMEYHNEEELRGKSAAGLFNTTRQFDEVRDAVIRKGSWCGERVLRKSDNSPFPVLLGINTARDETGKDLCILVTSIDITDRKQIDAVKREELEQIGRNIGQFTILGDHIRNPLAVIVGLSSMAPGDITDKIILQAREIDQIITQLDKGWIEAENVRNFIRKYYPAGTSGSDETMTRKTGP
jgi:PAS domain S-box-containing protein